MLLYFLIYLPWFVWLESRENLPYHVIHTGIDDYIPFVEIFVIPYLLWFLYVAVVFIYLFFKNKREYYRFCIFLFTGMTLFLMISTVYPNGHLLRPASFERHNIFTMAIQFIYQADTATNIFPSIHVFNSIATHLAVMNTESLRKNRTVRTTSLVLMVSIILSTVLIKQHSVVDLIGGILLGLVMNQLVYHTDYAAIRARSLARRRRAGKNYI